NWMLLLFTPHCDPSSVFNDLRLEGNFCDAVIKVEDVEFPIHKIILCKCSPYFRAMFKGRSTTDKKVFGIDGLSPEMMQLIIEFAYTGSVSVTEDNAQELLLATHQLYVMEIVQACSDFLGEQLSPKNCIGIWQLTNTCLSPELQRKAYRYITDHFEEVVSCEEFPHFSVRELTAILGRDDLNVRKESIVYEAILHWIAHAPEERKKHIAVLFSKFRLALTNKDYINMKVLSNELVRNSPECNHTVIDVLKRIHIIKNSSWLSGLRKPLTCPRLPNAVLLAIGGWSGGNPTNSIEAYNIRADCWINVTSRWEHPRAYHGTAFLDGYVYCVGGFDRLEHFNSVRRYDPSTRSWTEAAPMHCCRCYVSVTVLNGYIYAVGGFDGHTRLSTAERYRPEANQWSLIAPMHEQRSDASCTTLRNKVYICGGFNGNECLQTCECYSPETNQWTRITPMNSWRSGVGVIAYADHVYAVGGFDGHNRLSSVEAYNPRTDTWHAVSSMRGTRSNFGIGVIDDQLFVVGGFDGFTTSFKAEYYDATVDEWSEACNMKIFRSALSCCVVHGLPNMNQYALPPDALPFLYLEDDSVDSGDSI
uniref:BTB domain-containing protein n=2 Tax=Dicentrarchus labrax TaxID=13489 RepID=A0A8C4ERN4_DICLA